MGRRGPVPAPGSLKLLRGERADRLNTAEPPARSGPLTRPAWLTGRGAEEWDRVAPDLAHMGTAKPVDAQALAAYCGAVATLAEVTEELAGMPLLLRGSDGSVRKNPLVAQRRDASIEVRMWAREFGFTPSARQGIRVDLHVSAPAAGAERLLS